MTRMTRTIATPHAPPWLLKDGDVEVGDSLRKVHAAQEVLEARVGAQTIVLGQAEVRHVRIADLKGFFQPLEGKVFLAALKIQFSHSFGANVRLVRALRSKLRSTSHRTRVPALGIAPIKSLFHLVVTREVRLRFQECIFVHPLEEERDPQRAVGIGRVRGGVEGRTGAGDGIVIAALVDQNSGIKTLEESVERV